MKPGEPEIVTWAKKIAAIGQTGLEYAKDQFDIERYQELQLIAAEIISRASSLSLPDVLRNLEMQTGYATPKVDVRGCVFRGDEILLVQETSDGLWTMPGGWADVGMSPSECVEKEVREESGCIVKAQKLAAVYDRRLHEHTPNVYDIYKLFFICRLIEGEPVGGHETLGADFFPIDALPPLSVSRITEKQIRRMLEHSKDPLLPTDFD